MCQPIELCFDGDKVCVIKVSMALRRHGDTCAGPMELCFDGNKVCVITVSMALRGL